MKKQTKKKNVTFKSAVNSFFHRYIDFKGVSTRAEYWWVVLAFVICVCAAFAINSILAAVLPTLAGAWWFVCGVAALALIIPSLALFVRRAHDCGFSGWAYYGPLVGIWVASVLLAFVAKTFGSNQLIRALMVLVTYCGYGLSIWGLVLTLLPTKTAGNKYRRK